MSIKLCICPLAVKKEGTAGLNVRDHIVLGEVRIVVASNEVCLIDIVGRLDGRITESEVRNGDTACLLGVILEVCLNELIGVVSDDLDRVLVCSNRSVSAKTPELALDHIGRRGIGSCGLGKRETCKIVYDTNGEVILGSRLAKVSVNREDRCGSSILRTKTVSAADNLDTGSAGLSKSGNNVKIKGLAKRAGLLGSIENCDLLNGCGNSLSKLLGNEGTVKSYLDKTDLLALSKHIVDNLFSNVANRTHSDDNAVCIGCAVVVEELIICAELLVDLAHILLNDCGKRIVISIASLSVLEEDISILSGASESRGLGVERAIAECLDSVKVNHISKILIIPRSNLLDLVRGTESVKEIEERNSSLNGSKVSDRAEVHDLLSIGLCEHRKACLTASVNVGVVSENVKSVGSYASCGNVNNARKKLAGDLIHVGYHKKKTLRSSVGRSKRA